VSTTTIARINVLLITLGSIAAYGGHWWVAAGMWVLVVADRLDDIAVAARHAAEDKE
jgi:hypothetical protein